MNESTKEVKSIKDFVGEHLSKKFKICPPMFENDRVHWAPSAYVKKGEVACHISGLVQSKLIQEKLLDITTDFVFISTPDEWGSIIIYIKLPREISDAVEAIPKTYYRRDGWIEPKEALLHFAEGNYIRFTAIDEGSCTKKCINNHLEWSFRDILNEDEAEKWFLNIVSRRLFKQYSFTDVEWSDRATVEKVSTILHKYITDNDILDRIRLSLFEASDLWYDNLRKEEQKKQEAEIAKKLKREAEIQGYVDWVESGSPVYHRYGFAWKGAEAYPISKEDAVKMIRENRPYEYEWCIINGQKSLVLQEYGENDWY